MLFQSYFLFHFSYQVSTVVKLHRVLSSYSTEQHICTLVIISSVFTPSRYPVLIIKFGGSNIIHKSFPSLGPLYLQPLFQINIPLNTGNPIYLYPGTEIAQNYVFDEQFSTQYFFNREPLVSLASVDWYVFTIFHRETSLRYTKVATCTRSILNRSTMKEN